MTFLVESGRNLPQTEVKMPANEHGFGDHKAQFHSMYHSPTKSYKYRFFNGGCGNVPALDVFVFCDDPSPFAISSSSQLKVEAVSGAQ
jgi:hypothetical protein